MRPPSSSSTPSQQQQQQPPPTPSQPPQKTTTTTPAPAPPTPLPLLTPTNPLLLFTLGSLAFLASTTLTRRAIHRRHLRTKPTFYAPNTNPHEHFSPFHDAAQALNLATMNCVSLATMGVGGTLWAFGVDGVGEMRERLRRRLGYAVIYRESVGERPPEGLLEVLRVAGETRVVEGEEGGVTEGKK
ncbi:hypothetical protein DM02DRAFT_609660 [Periconia macrospinosa]|uniref:Altered inheritance of mitochondria protein 11 n=1 Tax=Periconia macrospinosa TaxID=97972 RepID=A0A2V1E9Z7_9PLEO|nr:hypothetical protein DM02DRAFT_609660 [Periconia macrospinosa]